MSNQKPTRGNIILGLDPGLNITGYGLIDVHGSQPELVEAGIIRSTKSDNLPTRLAAIYDGIVDVIQSARPDIVAIEDLYSHYNHPTTSILMGHARGVMCLAVAQNQLPLHHYAATQVKKIMTGNGRAPKNQVQLAVAKQLNLTDVPEPPDVADALAIAMCHYYMSHKPASLL
ncbi:MAG: crossover junction endodeoxyribonuclease RuvC [Mariniblastus sp.]|nr:crossover junction endodeoxyribonuclease RuvC [Mariniblastus sp.]